MQQTRDAVLVQLAREIAIDHLDSETILNLYSITPEEWRIIAENPRFQKLLESEISAWNSATNTTERTRLKAGAILEQWLPEANQRLHDPNETLTSKTELAKMMSRVAGLEKPEGGPGTNGNGFTVTINLGNTQPMTFDKLPSKVIDVSPNS